MISLKNIFIAVGTLSECSISIYPSHIRTKFGLKVNGSVVTIHYNINRKFHQEQYDEFISIIPYLHGEIDTTILVNNMPYSTILKDEPTRIFISGNLMEKSSRIFFNAGYIKVSNQKKDIFDITLQGIWTDKGFLNITSDTPIIFNLEKKSSSLSIKEIKAKINLDYSVKDDIVFPLYTQKELDIISEKDCGKTLNKKDVDNYLLEWEIVNG